MVSACEKYLCTYERYSEGNVYNFLVHAMHIQAAVGSVHSSGKYEDYFVGCLKIVDRYIYSSSF